MADFNITVDTSEMARSIDSVKGHVDGVTGAVVAMETAVVAAQKMASSKICANVDNGFYMLMSSQLSQKIAAVSSEMYSRKQLMESFKNEIDKIMLIMTDDYNRIHRRYSKHFESLNKALDTRVHELDKRAYELAKNYKTSQFKVGNDVLKTFIYNDETQRINVQEVNATVKNKSSKAIGVMTGDVIESITYEKSVGHILKDSSITEQEQAYIPVIVAETESVITQNTNVSSVYVPENHNLPKDDVLNHVQMSSEEFSWTTVDDVSYDAVKNSFMKLCNTDGINDRVLKEMLRLLDASKWDCAKVPGVESAAPIPTEEVIASESVEEEVTEETVVSESAEEKVAEETVEENVTEEVSENETPSEDTDSSSGEED